MQTLTVQDYRGITELADIRLNSLCVYWSKHPNGSRRYERYATTLFQTQLNLCKEVLTVNLPHNLYNWPFRFSAHIDYFKSLVNIHDQPFNLGAYFEFLRHILRNIQPTSSRLLNAFQLAEIEFVITEAKDFPNKDGAKKLLAVAEVERKILSEDCESSYYLNYRFHYLREEIKNILDQDLYSGSVRYALWKKIVDGRPDYTRHDQVWIDKTSEELERGRCQTWSQEDWCRNSLLFFNELLSDFFFAKNNSNTDGPDELSYKFKRGIGLLVRCDEAEFLIQGADAACEELKKLTEGGSAPDWVSNCLDEAEGICENTKELLMPTMMKKENFVLF